MDKTCPVCGNPRLSDAKQQNKMYADSVSQLKCLIEAEFKSRPKMKIGF